MQHHCDYCGLHERVEYAISVCGKGFILCRKAMFLECALLYGTHKIYLYFVRISDSFPKSQKFQTFPKFLKFPKFPKFAKFPDLMCRISENIRGNFWKLLNFWNFGIFGNFGSFFNVWKIEIWGILEFLQIFRILYKFWKFWIFLKFWKHKGALCGDF